MKIYLKLHKTKKNGLRRTLLHNLSMAATIERFTTSFIVTAGSLRNSFLFT
jgi:hypothetical protein